VIPRENEPDLEELPAETREALQFVLADSIDEVLATALNGGRTKRPVRERRATARA
jgi:ATP-dependent Lon protease